MVVDKTGRRRKKKEEKARSQAGLGDTICG